MVHPAVGGMRRRLLPKTILPRREGGRTDWVGRELSEPGPGGRGI